MDNRSNYRRLGIMTIYSEGHKNKVLMKPHKEQTVIKHILLILISMSFFIGQTQSKLNGVYSKKSLYKNIMSILNLNLMVFLNTIEVLV